MKNAQGLSGSAFRRHHNKACMQSCIDSSGRIHITERIPSWPSSAAAPPALPAASLPKSRRVGHIHRKGYLDEEDDRWAAGIATAISWDESREYEGDPVDRSKRTRGPCRLCEEADRGGSLYIGAADCPLVCCLEDVAFSSMIWSSPLE